MISLLKHEEKIMKVKANKIGHFKTKIFKNDDTTYILKTSNLPEEIFASCITGKGLVLILIHK